MSDMRTWASDQDELQKDFEFALENPSILCLAQFYKYITDILTEIDFDKEVRNNLLTIGNNLLDLMRVQSRVPLNRLAISNIINRRLSNG